MPRASGVVQKANEKWETKSGKRLRSPLYSVDLDGVWYNFGFDDPGVSEGEVVSFDFKVGAYGNDGDASTVTKEAAGSKAATTATQKSDDRQVSIVYQSQHRDALEAVKFMSEQGIVKLPAKQSDKYDVFLGLVKDLTVQWTNEALHPDLSTDGLTSEELAGDPDDE